jgi:hypothetical protein
MPRGGGTEDFVSLETNDARPIHPTSERWLQYYKEARVRRRARGPEVRTSVLRRRWRNRQRTMLVSGVFIVSALVSVFYFVLSR